MELVIASQSLAGNEPSREDAVAALRHAVQFYRSEVSDDGGYVWLYSSDLKLRQGEGLAYDRRIWVQPPGTPAVGLAMLDAFRATGDSLHLSAATAAAEALVNGQLHSGGWDYSITSDPKLRAAINYRVAPTKGKPVVRRNDDDVGGWSDWRKRRYQANKTVLDDNTTQSALRLLMHVDQALKFKNQSIHEAVQYGLSSLMMAQYSIGAWSHNYDRFPRRNPDPSFYPVKSASYPDPWSRRWTKDFNGCYMINDRITLDAIKTLLDAYEVYADSAYLDAATKGGEFLLLAQMPEPQPAWAQQYDRKMQPVWDRGFEPPAVCGLESQDVLESLLLLYERTGERRYLKAVARALSYLRHSQLVDGKLARYYELHSNRPLYFTNDYQLTYEQGEMPDHYQFVVNSRLDAIAMRYRTLAHGGPDARPPAPTRTELAETARRIIHSMDHRGAWAEPGSVRDSAGRKVTPANGVIRSETFCRNVRELSQYVAHFN